MRAIALLLLSAHTILAASTVRLVSYGGGTIRIGVSTDQTQFAILSSQDHTNWVDRGRTWIIRGGTNEVVITIALPPSAQTTFLKLAP